MTDNMDTHHTACCGSSYKFVKYNGKHETQCLKCGKVPAECIFKTLGIQVNEDIRLTEHLAG